ncbi:MAG: DUF4258 domain-containing protein [Rhodospirillales bacterium]|nr:DUF4258 domain-containing protein [Rhodospirillales bacterium]
MSRAQALKLIREAADDTGRIILTRHAEQRMRQRRITMSQVVACLRKGVITEGPALDIKGGWACRIEGVVAGDHVKVALAIDPVAKVIIITVM